MKDTLNKDKLSRKDKDMDWGCGNLWEGRGSV